MDEREGSIFFTLMNSIYFSSSFELNKSSCCIIYAWHCTSPYSLHFGPRVAMTTRINEFSQLFQLNGLMNFSFHIGENFLTLSQLTFQQFNSWDDELRICDSNLCSLKVWTVFHEILTLASYSHLTVVRFYRIPLSISINSILIGKI